MTFTEEQVDTARWFLCYAAIGAPSWVAHRLLAERFRLSPDDALELFKSTKGGADADA